MQFVHVAAVLAALGMTVSASTLQVQNKCSFPVYLTSTTSDQKTTGPNQLVAGGSYSQSIVGTGNSLGVTTNSDYYSANTAKLIIGTSTSSGTLYWSPSDVNGDPFAGQNISITSDNLCGSATSADGQTRGCADNNVPLTVTLCSS